MDLGIRGKKVIVTSSSKGLGFATAKRFLEEGAEVVISSHDEKNLEAAREKLSKIGRVIAIKADLYDPKQGIELIRKGVDALGGLDVFVYIAPPPKPGTIFNLELDDWERAAYSLMITPVMMVKEAVSYMRPGGRIIISTSISVRQPLENLDLSNVIRTSLVGLIKTASNQLAPKGILVNGVMPGLIFTDRVKQLIEVRAKQTGKSEEEVIKEMVRDIPMGRIGDPEEFANVILFLASNYATYITGAIIPIDGGMLKTSF